MMALEILVIGQPSGSIQCYSPKYATVRNLLPVDIDYSFETASRVTFPLRCVFQRGDVEMLQDSRLESLKWHSRTVATGKRG